MSMSRNAWNLDVMNTRSEPERQDHKGQNLRQLPYVLPLRNRQESISVDLDSPHRFVV